MIIQKKEGKEQKKEDSWHFWSPCGSDIVINNLCVRHVTTALWGERSYCPHFTNEGKLDLESKPSPSCWINYDSQPTTQPLLCYVIIDRTGPVFSVTNSQTRSLPAITFCDSMYFKRFLCYNCSFRCQIFFNFHRNRLKGKYVYKHIFLFKFSQLCCSYKLYPSIILSTSSTKPPKPGKE